MIESILYDFPEDDTVMSIICAVVKLLHTVPEVDVDVNEGKF